MTRTDKHLRQIRWDPEGLLPVVVQDHATEQVLMVAYMNREALLKTLRSGYAHFWSRSRRTLWKKGETSGNIQKVREIRIDCDGDTLLLRVKPDGPACHTGSISCFYRSASRGRWVRMKNGSSSSAILRRIYDVIEDRKSRPKRDSYVSGLLKSGRDKILKKIGEEAGEAIIASKNGGKGDLIHELADLWFHTLVLMAHHDVTPEALYGELQRRFGTSGQKEKASRNRKAKKQ